MTRSTSELERDAEATRAKLSTTLEELRGKVEPGNLADQAFAFARNNGGADFIRNAGAQARDNPLPILLIGAGLAWLMSGRRPSSGPSVGALQDGAMRRTHDARDAASGVIGAVTDGASGVMGAVSDAASAVTGGLRDAAASGSSGVRQVGSSVSGFGTAAGESLQSGGARAQDAFGRLQAMFADNPVAIGALGIAVGAAIGAALPATETEDRLMGAQADEIKAAAKAKAEEQVERGKTVVSAGLEEVRQDLKPDATSNAETTTGENPSSAQAPKPFETAKPGVSPSV